MVSTKREEAGQIIVIMAVAIVALLGFAALAIDVGMVYADRRYDQNVADAAAMAGAQAAGALIVQVNGEDFDCTTHAGVIAAKSAAQTAAIQRAQSNRFSISTVTNLNTPQVDHGVEVTCHNTWPKYLEVMVKISGETNPNFIQLFGRGVTKNTVSAVTRVVPRDIYDSGMSLISLSKDSDSFVISGNVTIQIDKGGIFSNGNIGKNGNGSGNITVTDGAIAAVGTIDTYNWHGTVIPHWPTLFKPAVTKPNCSSGVGAVDRTSGNKAATGLLEPGTYNQGIGGGAVLKPGLYCVRGGITLNGNDKILNQSLDDNHGVTIMLLDGDLKMNGNSDTQLYAPDPDLAFDPSTGAIPGVLFYVDENNSCNSNSLSHPCFYLTGTNDSVFQGTIYVPNGVADLGGNNKSTAPWNTQVIANKITFHGNPNLYLNSTTESNVVYPMNINMQR